MARFRARSRRHLAGYRSLSHIPAAVKGRRERQHRLERLYSFISFFFLNLGEEIAWSFLKISRSEEGASNLCNNIISVCNMCIRIMLISLIEQGNQRSRGDYLENRNLHTHRRNSKLLSQNLEHHSTPIYISKLQSTGIKYQATYLSHLGPARQ